MSEAQGIQVGTVVAVSGSAVRVCVLENLDLERIPLQPGERVHQQQVLETSDDARLVIQWDDGRTWIIESGQRVEVFAGFDTDDYRHVESGFDTDEVDPEVKAMQEALARGDDPLELEATAAGNSGGGNDDGTRVVILDRGNQADPYQAFTTPGLDTDRVGNDPRDGDVNPPDALSVDDPAGGPLTLSVVGFAGFESFSRFGGFTSLSGGGGKTGGSGASGGLISSSAAPRGGSGSMAVSITSGQTQVIQQPPEPTLQQYLEAGIPVFAIRLSEPSTERVSVNWELQAGTATVSDGLSLQKGPSGDFVLAFGTAIFEPGDVEVLVPVQVLNDSLVENPESLSIVLSDPVNVDLGNSSAEALINDNDQIEFNLDVSSSFFDEQNNHWVVEFRVSYEGELADGVDATVAVNTADGSVEDSQLAAATGGDAPVQGPTEDYLSFSDVLTFAGGEDNEQFILVSLAGDVDVADGVEILADEYFSMSLSDTSANAIVGTGVQVVGVADES